MFSLLLSRLKLVSLLFILFSQPALSSTIFYDVQNISGNTWEYTYTVENDTLTTDIEEFSVFFDYSLYTNLVTTGSPVGWDPIVVQPDTIIPDDGFFDALAMSVPGISSGSLLSGFTVQFDYLGTNAPSSQYFEIVDPVNFSVLDSGYTMLNVSVPAPSSLALMGLGFLVLRRLKSKI